MDLPTSIALGINFIFFGGIFIALIYLVLRRIELRKKENFEHRDY